MTIRTYALEICLKITQVSIQKGMFVLLRLHRRIRSIMFPTFYILDKVIMNDTCTIATLTFSEYIKSESK